MCDFVMNLAETHHELVLASSIRCSTFFTWNYIHSAAKLISFEEYIQVYRFEKDFSVFIFCVGCAERMIAIPVWLMHRIIYPCLVSLLSHIGGIYTFTCGCTLGYVAFSFHYRDIG
eukprot:67345_1